MRISRGTPEARSRLCICRTSFLMTFATGGGSSSRWLPENYISIKNNRGLFLQVISAPLLYVMGSEVWMSAKALGLQRRQTEIPTTEVSKSQEKDASRRWERLEGRRHGWKLRSAIITLNLILLIAFIQTFICSSADFLNFIFYVFVIFWPHCSACGVLVPQPGIEPTPPVVEAQTTREPLNHQGSHQTFRCMMKSQK